MGYDLFITRARGWQELLARTHPISRGEWEAVVAADSSLLLSSEDWFERILPDGSTERLLAVIWLAHPGRVPFWFADGSIHAKNPDPATVDKMVELAERLQSRVLGEEGEEYHAGRSFTRPEGYLG